MDLDLINNTIEELENSDTTFINCQNLASLYAVRENYKLRSSLLTEDEAVAKELSDLFPQYRKYREIKRKYQLNELSEKAVTSSMELLCKELQEFLMILYRNSDLPEERKSIKCTLDSVISEYEKTA